MIDEPIVYGASRTRMIFGLFFCGAVGAIGVRFVTATVSLHPLLPLSLQPVIGGGCILFAAYQVAFCLMKLFTNRPGLIVDDTGLTIGANILPARFVCWDEIARISTKRLMGSSILEITLHDRDAVLKRAGPLSVFVDRIRIGANTTSINVPPVAVDTDIDALAERLKAFHKSKTPKPASPPAPKTI